MTLLFPYFEICTKIVRIPFKWKFYVPEGWSDVALFITSNNVAKRGLRLYRERFSTENLKNFFELWDVTFESFYSFQPPEYISTESKHKD